MGRFQIYLVLFTFFWRVLSVIFVLFCLNHVASKDFEEVNLKAETEVVKGNIK